jgi:hypothetical protein
VAIVVGLVILGLFPLAVRRTGARGRRLLTVFVVVWLVACAGDLTVGVSHGYGFGEEFAIHLLIFAVPAAAALVLARTAGPWLRLSSRPAPA